jgi:TetR/AcrR family transcriptional regulator, repressor for neighboring sulfatase
VTDAVDGAAEPLTPLHPRGRDEVSQAILEAALELFAERDPGLVSLREVAARAGVNYGLLHRHFGSKTALVRSALDLEREAMAARAREVDDLDEALETLFALYTSRRITHARTIAWAVLAGIDPAELGSTHPTSRRLLELLEARHGPDATGANRRRLALLVSLTLGWALYGGFSADVAGLSPDDVDEVERELLALARRIVSRPDDA